MSTLPTSSERTDTVLTLAKTRAAAYADAGNLEMAYKALLRGVQSAQRVNNSSDAGTTLAGLWAMPATKAGLLGGTAAIAAAVNRSKSKSKKKVESSSTLSGPATSSSDSSASRRGRFRRPRTTNKTTTVSEPTVTTAKLGD